MDELQNLKDRMELERGLLSRARPAPISAPMSRTDRTCFRATTAVR